MMVEFRKSDMIKMTLIHLNDWNPNVQTDETLNQLHEEIKADGFDHPLNVCHCTCDKIAEPHYVVIGGEHRYKVLKLEEAEEVPCTINDWTEEQQKFKTVRRNLITGDLDKKKFTELVKSLDDSVDRAVMPELFGFDSDKEFQKFVIEEREKADKSFLDELMAETRKEKFAVEALTDIIAEIFGSVAGTLDQNYMHFSYKGKDQLVIQMDDDTFKVVTRMTERLSESGEMATDFIVRAIESQLT